jgi:hypothetical protein
MFPVYNAHEGAIYTGTDILKNTNKKMSVERENLYKWKHFLSIFSKNYN